MNSIHSDSFYFKVAAMGEDALKIASTLILGQQKSINAWKVEDGKLFLNFHYGETAPAGYTKLPFAIPAEDIWMFCLGWLKSAEYPDNPYDSYDGSSTRGWGIETIDTSIWDGKTVVFYPTWMYHSK